MVILVAMAQGAIVMALPVSLAFHLPAVLLPAPLFTAPLVPAPIVATVIVTPVAPVPVIVSQQRATWRTGHAGRGQPWAASGVAWCSSSRDSGCENRGWSLHLRGRRRTRRREREQAKEQYPWGM